MAAAYGASIPSRWAASKATGGAASRPKPPCGSRCAFGTSADFWMNLQTRYDLAIAKESIGDKGVAEVEQVRQGRVVIQ